MPKFRARIDDDDDVCSLEGGNVMSFFISGTALHNPGAGAGGGGEMGFSFSWPLTFYSAI